MDSAWPSWLSPIGWAQQVRPFARRRAGGCCGCRLAFFVASLHRRRSLLTAHRDVGTGMLPTRPGPATASSRLLSPLGLAWRLQRGVLLGWAVGVAVMAVPIGAVGDAVDDMVGDNDAMAEMLRQLGGGGTLVDTFFARC